MPVARMGQPMRSTNVVEVSYREILLRLSTHAIIHNGTATSQNGGRCLLYLGTVPSYVRKIVSQSASQRPDEAGLQ